MVLANVPVYAQGEHARRIAAELLVMRGDLLLIREDVSKMHRVGLNDRIKGSLVTLEILARLADQESLLLQLDLKTQASGESPDAAVNRHSSVPIVSLRQDIAVAYQFLHRESYSEVAAFVDKLIANYPLVLPDLAEREVDPAASLHKSLCSACHDRPNNNVERPAYNLFEQSKSVDRVEMFARMLVGVRGDRVTGIDNPLTDIQIMGLLDYYLSE